MTPAFLPSLFLLRTRIPSLLLSITKGGDTIAIATTSAAEDSNGNWMLMIDFPSLLGEEEGDEVVCTVTVTYPDETEVSAEFSFTVSEEGGSDGSEEPEGGDKNSEDGDEKPEGDEA